MKNLFIFLIILLASLTTSAELLKTASLNLEGWADSSNSRALQLNQLFQSQGFLKDVSFLMVQESIEYKGYSTASQLASLMGWKSFTHPRATDFEGLGFIYPAKTQIQSIDVLQIQARESESDYARMALSAQVKHKTLGKIRYVTTHLAHKPDMVLTRKRQIAEILTWLKKLESNNSSQLIILGGDFNTDTKSPTYANEFDLMTHSNFQFRLSPSEGASYSWSEGLEKALIDYFFVASPTIGTKKQISKTTIYPQTIEQGISDHALLVLTLDTRP